MDLQAFFDRLRNEPIGQRIIAEEAEQTLIKRQGLIDRIRAIRADFDRALPGLIAAVAAAEVKHQAAVKAAADARAELLAASAARREATSRADHAQNDFFAQLKATASPSIGEFIDEVDNAIYEWRNAAMDVNVVPKNVPLRRNWIEPPMKLEYTPTGDRLIARAISVRHKACALYYQVFDETTLAARIEKLRAELHGRQAAA